MQAFRAWSPPSGTLGGIVEEAYLRAKALRERSAELERGAARVGAAPSFASALRQPTVAIVAEVKRRSPSKGWIQPSLSAAAQARAYQGGGAAAISVLTEPEHFAGSTRDLTDVREAVSLPILKKDFHVEPIQLLEAKALGASAALLIARALPPDALRSMLDEARQLGLEALVEVRDERELELALALRATLLGINNRDLETLRIDATTSLGLLTTVPPEIVAIAESGVACRADVERLGQAGADAVLVGSSISASADPGNAVRELAGAPRVSRER